MLKCINIVTRLVTVDGVLDWQLDLLDSLTTRGYTLQFPVTHMH
jgi:hypothetical protein